MVTVKDITSILNIWKTEPPVFPQIEMWEGELNGYHVVLKYDKQTRLVYEATIKVLDMPTKSE